MVISVWRQNIVVEHFVHIDTFPASFVHTKWLLQHLRVLPGNATCRYVRVFKLYVAQCLYPSVPFLPGEWKPLSILLLHSNRSAQTFVSTRACLTLIVLEIRLLAYWSVLRRQKHALAVREAWQCACQSQLHFQIRNTQKQRYSAHGMRMWRHGPLSTHKRLVWPSPTNLSGSARR